MNILIRPLTSRCHNGQQIFPPLLFCRSSASHAIRRKKNDKLDLEKPTTSKPPLQTLRQRLPWMTRRTMTDDQQILLLQQKDNVQLSGLFSTDPRALLSTQQWHMAYPISASLAYLPELTDVYMQLAKARLTALVTVTALAGYAMAPEPMTMLSLASCVIGTALMSTSANSFNQYMEIPYDSQMKRTQARVLVTGRVTPLHACTFAIVAATAGATLLYTYTNPITTGLGLANIVLYAFVYTPLKRVSISCTWAGAVVGAIPPLMGYAACAGVLTPAAATMAAILYAWQFPHFNALSWNLRPDYSRAGYRVMCVTNPALCVRTTLRYSVLLTGLCSIGAPLTELTSWSFAVDSLPLNAILLYLSYKFYSEPNAQTSRRLFRYSLIYLPSLMLLMIIGNYERNKGLIERKKIAKIEAAKTVTL
jgi:protoheme IX farnesyltransferase